jgi:hypothetical protein
MRWGTGKGRGVASAPAFFFAGRRRKTGPGLPGLGFKRVKFMDGGVVHWPFELETGGPGEKKSQINCRIRSSASWSTFWGVIPCSRQRWATREARSGSFRWLRLDMWPVRRPT